MTQKEQIVNFLLDNEVVCGTVFQSSFIPEYRTRINDLRKEGYLIGARPCTQHQHKSKILQEWYFIDRPKIAPSLPETHNVPPAAVKSFVEANGGLGVVLGGSPSDLQQAQFSL